MQSLQGKQVSETSAEKLEIAHEASAESLVTGRFMLPDLSEHACQVINLSVDGAIFITPSVPPPGQLIVAYIEEIGRVEALTGAPQPGGFAITFNLKGPRLERFQQRVEWLQQRGTDDASDSRRHSRYEPGDRVSQVTLPDGRVYNCEVLDISVSGAGIKTEVVPSVGTYVMLGKMRGRVVRYLEHGVAIEFVKQLDQAPSPTAKIPAQS